MKKIFNYLLIIALLFGIGMPFVNAEGDGNASFTGNGDTDATVTVGDVDIPTYNVSISWTGFIFDWKYDEQSLRYDWIRTKPCVHIDGDYDFYDIVDNYSVYYDSTCSNEILLSTQEKYEWFENKSDGYYLAEAENATIEISDFSEGGYVTPSIQWKSAEKYEGTTATFSYIKDFEICNEVDLSAGLYDSVFYTDANCTNVADIIGSGITYYEKNVVPVTTELIGEDVELSFEEDSNMHGTSDTKHNYLINLDLHHQYDVGNYEVPTPTAGDTIGTVTISIETH